MSNVRWKGYPENYIKTCLWYIRSIIYPWVQSFNAVNQVKTCLNIKIHKTIIEHALKTVKCVLLLICLPISWLGITFNNLVLWRRRWINKCLPTKDIYGRDCNVISSYPPFNDGKARFTTTSLNLNLIRVPL